MCGIYANTNQGFTQDLKFGQGGSVCEMCVCVIKMAIEGPDFNGGVQFKNEQT